MTNIKQQLIEGLREEIIQLLKSKANKNCKKCYGRGYIGYKEDKQRNRNYIACPKCINKND